MIWRADDVITPPLERFVLCYDKFPPDVDGINKEIEYLEGIRNANHILDGNLRTLVVIEDLMSETNQKMTSLLTKGSLHRNANVIYVCQNIFPKGKEPRTINLYTHYIAFFQNPRDAIQLLVLGRQTCPEDVKYFRQAIEDTSSQPHHYMLIDLKPTTPEEIRLRDRMFP